MPGGYKHKSGNQKRKKKEEEEEKKKKLPKIEFFFSRTTAAAAASCSSSSSDASTSSTASNSSVVTTPNENHSAMGMAVDTTTTPAAAAVPEVPMLDTAEEDRPTTEREQEGGLGQGDSSDTGSEAEKSAILSAAIASLHKNPTDIGHYAEIVDAATKKYIVAQGSCRPQGPFPRDPNRDNRCFSTSYYSTSTKSVLELPRRWLCL